MSNRIRLTRIASITSELDRIADEVQKYNPKLALAIDKISDHMENRTVVLAEALIMTEIPTMTEYRKDNTPENRKDIGKLKSKILGYVKNQGKATMSEIYEDLKCEDTPMYLAIHDLVKEKKLEGESPYESHKNSHDKFIYTLKTVK